MKKYFKLLFLFITSTTAIAQSINLSVSNSFLTIPINQSDTISAFIIPAGGFNHQVILTETCLSGSCIGISFTFTPNPINFPYTNGILINISINGSCLPGQYQFSIKGSNGPVSDSAIIIINATPDQCQLTPLSQPLYFGSSRSMLVNESGFWFANGNLVHYDRNTLTTYSQANSQLPGYTYDIAQDTSNNIWLATHQGIAKFDGTFWTIFNTSNSVLTTNNISSVAVDDSNKVWFGTHYNVGSWNGGGLYKYDGTWTVYDSLNSPLPSNSIGGVSFDNSGNLWCVSYSYSLMDAVVVKFDGTNWSLYSHQNSCLYSSIHYTDIQFDSHGNTWMGMGNECNQFNQRGILKTDWNTWEVWLDSNATPYNHYVYDSICNIIIQDNVSRMPPYGAGELLIDNDDNIWAPPSRACTGGWGLVKLSNGNFQIFTDVNSTLMYKSVSALAEYNDTVWIASGPSYISTGSDFLHYYTCNSIINYADNHVSEYGISVYPNPTQSSVTIDLPENLLSTNYIFRIYDFSGKLIYKSDLIAGKNLITIPDVNPGAFLYEIIYAEKSIRGKLIILE